MKILTIVPSIHPKKLAYMMDSYLDTRSDCNDIRINYEEKSITEIFNQVFNSHPDYDFYFMANDDILFKTPEWDLKLANKGKISYGNDLLQGENLCSFPMIDGNIVRSLGWLQMPKLNRYAGDVVWKFIGQSLGILEYHPEVIISHQWEGCTHPDINTLDMAEFAKWLPWAFKDLTKIREVLNEPENIKSTA